MHAALFIHLLMMNGQRQYLIYLLLAEHQNVMFHAEIGSYIFSQGKVLPFLHAHGETLDIGVYLIGHVCYQAAVQASAEENPPDSVVLHALLSCLLQQLTYNLLGLIIGLKLRGLDSRRAKSLEPQFAGINVTGGELLNIIGYACQGLCLRGKAQISITVSIVKRFYARPVTGQYHFTPVRYGTGKVTVQLLGKPCTKLFIEVQHSLSISHILFFRIIYTSIEDNRSLTVRCTM